MALIQQKIEGLDKGEPEWRWRLRAVVSSTTTFQRHKDFWNAFWTGLSGSRGKKRLREIITPDHRLRLYSKILPVACHIEKCGLPPFGYNALEQSDTFRLLQVQPGSFSDPLRCKLVTCNIHQAPSYKALSYTWGEKIGHEIDVDGRSLFIRENLCTALRTLRRERTARLLWVDAICINQSNIAERNHQVCLMGGIYQNAARVLVWLGQSSADSSQAFKLLSQVNALQKSSDAMDLTRPLKSEDLTVRGLPEPSCPSWRALDALYWREWFTRVWVIQEIAMAKEAIVICGKDYESWETFETVAEFLLCDPIIALVEVDPKRTIKLAEFRKSQEYPRDQLLHLLIKARDSFATDDRDKVYAMLFMVLEEDRIALRPDYSKSVEEIYTSLARFFVDETRNLDVLSTVECHKYRLNSQIPTWVPDWDVHPISSSFVSFTNFSHMKSSGNSLPVVSFSQDNKLLSTRGVIVDTLFHSGETFWEHVPLPGSAMRRRSVVEPFTIKYGQALRDYQMRKRWGQWEMIAHKVKAYPTGEDVSTAYIRTLIADDELAANATPETYVQYYTAWLRYWNALICKNDNPKNYSPPPRPQEEMMLAIRFMKLHHRAAYGRRFFTSKRGYMGLGPQLSSYGDLIVVLLGGRTPYILRKDGKHHYRFVGECFVYGLMNGEALACDGNLQTFAIR